MKKIKYPVIALGLIFLAYCKSSKTASSTPTPVIVTEFTPSDKQMQVAQTRWPGATAIDVTEGRTIFVTKCTKCHEAFEITGFSEKKWVHEIEDMSPKANLTAEEKLKLTKHILSYREANTVTKAN